VNLTIVGGKNKLPVGTGSLLGNPAHKHVTGSQKQIYWRRERASRLNLPFRDNKKVRNMLEILKLSALLTVLKGNRDCFFLSIISEQVEMQYFLLFQDDPADQECTDE
jgi:hypothetical protein